MNICDEKTAAFMGEALLNQAREVCRYARIYPVEFRALPGRDSRERHQRFVASVARMVKEMRALMLMARRGGILRFCNHEQIDGYIEEAEEILAHFSAPARAEALAKVN